jgi:hypothetical protein
MEEISRLLLFFARPSAFGAKMLLAHLGLGPIRFFMNAIPAFIGTEINILVSRNSRKSSAPFRSGEAAWSE